MDRRDIYLISFIAILPLWVISFYPFLNILYKFSTPTYPIKILAYQITRLITTTSLLIIISIINGVLKILEERNIYNESKNGSKYYLIIFLIFSLPVASAYIYDTNNNSIGQMILNLAETLIDENFDDIPPGEDPPNWEEQDGDWAAYDDDGNIVYYQGDNSDKETLSISTSGDTSWVNYTVEVDMKFIDGSNRDGRAATIVFRYQGGNAYYILVLREYQDILEVYRRGGLGVGNLVGSVSCLMDTDVWYHVNVTIMGDIVNVTFDDVPYFVDTEMNGLYHYGSVGIGTIYYGVMFDNILVYPR